MSHDCDCAVAIVGVTLGGLALIAVFILSVILWIIWHGLQKVKGELISCKYQLEKLAPQSGKVVNPPTLIPLAPLDVRPTSPASNPKPIITDNVPGAGYSSVNALSLLPDSARTVENLEGETMPASSDQELLLEKFRKERQEYEEKQLQLCEGMRANRGAGDAAGKPAEKPAEILSENPTAVSHCKSFPAVEKPGLYNYDVIELPENKKRQIIVNDADEYGQPVDAIQQPVTGPPGAPLSILMPFPSDGQQKNVISMVPGGQAYTPVFNPRQQSKGQGKMREHQTMSDLSPCQNTGVERQLRRDSVENIKTPPPGSNGWGSGNGMEMAKEKMEFNPEHQRMFRMTSKKGRSKGAIKAGSDHTGAGIMEGKEVASTPQSRPPASQEYAMVNIADKKKNRIGPDISKCEGSGVPQHFVATPVLSF